MIYETTIQPEGMDEPLTVGYDFDCPGTQWRSGYEKKIKVVSVKNAKGEDVRVEEETVVRAIVNRIVAIKYEDAWYVNRQQRKQD